MQLASIEENWSRCLDRLEQKLKPQIFKTWFTPIRARSLRITEKGPHLQLEVPSQFFYEWLENRYSALLSETVREVVGDSTEISFRVAAGRNEEPLVDAPTERGMSMATEASLEGLRFSRPAPMHESAVTSRPLSSGVAYGSGRSPVVLPERGRRPAEGPHDTQLNPAYTFDSFIEGDCNRLARSAAQAIMENPGQTAFNPFLVYGGVGLGKTHLVQAIANSAIAAGWTGRALYVSSERFTSQFVQAIQENRVGDFTRYYRQIDLIVVDDVQFFGGKEKTQEEFFHIFNELHQSGRQIILSADRPPRDIDGIEERLLSRFQWGLIADVQPPELETRIAILQRKADSNGLELPGEVLEFVAHRVKSNVRKLEGALVRLAAHANLHGHEIDLAFASEVLGDFFEHRPEPLGIEDIKERVASFYRLDVNLLSDKTRRREVAQARQVAMFICKHYTRHPLKTIGLRFGGRDHSTVIHACRAVENRLDTEPGFDQEVERLKSDLLIQSPPAS